jgi:hypothetical protein
LRERSAVAGRGREEYDDAALKESNLLLAMEIDKATSCLSLKISSTLTGRYFRGHYDTCSHDMRASGAAAAAT